MSKRCEHATLPTPESAADVVAYLTSQHDRLASLMGRVMEAEPERRAEVFSAFRSLFAVHEASEQDIVHPRAKHELADGLGWFRRDFARSRSCCDP